MINIRQLIANQRIKTTLVTNGIILTIIHWKNSINILINSQKIYISKIVNPKNYSHHIIKNNYNLIIKSIHSWIIGCGIFECQIWYKTIIFFGVPLEFLKKFHCIVL